MLAVEKLHESAEELSQQAKRASAENVFAAFSSNNDLVEGISMFLNLLDAATQEVESCTFRKEGKQARFLEQLQLVRAALYELMIKRDRNSQGPLFSERHLGWLMAISEAVTEVLDGTDEPLDRAAFKKETEAFIEAVKSWKMEGFAQRSLLISLNLINGMTSVSNTAVSDTQIRRQVKSLVADFCVEFVELDKEFETWFETVKRWARIGYQGAPTPLGLTKAASEIAGLLPKP